MTLPTFDPVELSRLVSVRDDCESLVEYLRGFDITLSVMQTRYAITRAMYEVCEDAYLDGVRYIEVRFSPILHTRGGLSLSSVMEAVVEGKVMAELNLGIIPRIIVSGMRQMSPEVSKQLAEIAWRYALRGVVAFDLAGPEAGFGAKYHREAFKIIHQNMLNCTLHSGEAYGWESVLESLRFCGAQRIGHGVRMRENPELVQFCANMRIPIEICVTSNIQTKAVQGYTDHPLRSYYDKGLVVVPCTDNGTVSDITLSEEYFKIQNLYNFKVNEIVRMIDFGLRSAFVDLSLKKRMRAETMYTIKQVLERDGYDTSELFSPSSHLDVGFDYPQLYDNPHDVAYSTQVVDDEAVPVANGGDFDSRLKQFIERMPKADLNCRFAGSVSVDTLWENYINDREVMDEWLATELKLLGLTKTKLQSKQDIIDIIQPAQIHTHRSIDIAISFMSLFLQTKEQLEAGLDDIFRGAAADNVSYMELNIRPTLHGRRNFGMGEFIETMLQSVRAREKKYNIRTGVCIYVDMREDGPEAIRQMAVHAIAGKNKGIVGIGFYGGLDLSRERQSLFVDVFNMLKNNQIQVSMSAGLQAPESIITAIHECGAVRLNGCFKLHLSPEITNYLANHSIPVQVASTQTLKKAMRDVREFAGSPVRLLLDRGIKVLPVSYDMSLYNSTRSQQLFELAQDAKLNVRELISFMSTGFRTSFQDYWNRREMFGEFMSKAKEIGTELGFSSMTSTSFFTPPPASLSSLQNSKKG